MDLCVRDYCLNMVLEEDLTAEDQIAFVPLLPFLPHFMLNILQCTILISLFFELFMVVLGIIVNILPSLD